MGSFGEVPSSWQVMSRPGVSLHGVTCAVTPALDLKDPCKGHLILPDSLGTEDLFPIFRQHAFLSTNVYECFFFFFSPNCVFP